MEKYTDQELRKMIMDHYIEPKNKGFINDGSLILELSSPTCSDQLSLEISVDNNKIKTLRFEGVACAISTAAADLIIENCLNKSVDQAKIIIDNFEKMLHNQEYNEQILNTLIAFKNVSKQKNRITCATLLSSGIKENIG